jgi:acyl transferase domain-containing protein
MSGKVRAVNVFPAPCALAEESSPLVAESTPFAVTYNQPCLPIVSARTGRAATSEIGSAGYWRAQSRKRIMFSESIDTLQSMGCNVFVEVGPSGSLLKMAKSCIEPNQGVLLASLQRGRSAWDSLLESLGSLYVNGAPVDWLMFHRDHSQRRVMLPTYPFQRTRYWMEHDGTKQETANGMPLSNTL